MFGELGAVSRIILSAKTEDQLLTRTVESLARHTASQSVYVVTRDGTNLVARATHGVAASEAAATDPMVLQAVRDRVSIVAHAQEGHPAWGKRDAAVRAVICVPLVRPDKVLGALVIERREGAVYAAVDLQVAQLLTDLCALALENTRIKKHLNDSQHDMRNALSAASLLLYQVLGAETGPETDPSRRALHEAIAAELQALYNLAQGDGALSSRESYLSHISQLVDTEATMDALLRGVRTAVDRAINITGNMADQPSSNGVPRRSLADLKIEKQK
jgi:GAF domain-containing protein